MPNLIRYHFRQPFTASASAAFAWCTNFTPEDSTLMGNHAVQRRIQRVTESTLLLNDVFPTQTGTVEKQKLVTLFPDQFSWTSTHLTGPNKYSQFLYLIVPDGENASHLEFTALHLDYGDVLSQAEVQVLAQRLCKADSEIWARLAKAMTHDLTTKQSTNQDR